MSANPTGGQGSTCIHQLDDFELEGFLAVAARFGSGRFGFVVTPNVDHMIRCHEDVAFRSRYASADFALLDSRFAAQLLRLVKGLRLPVCTGSDLTAALFRRIIAPDDRIVLIGGSAQQAATIVSDLRAAQRAPLQSPDGIHHRPRGCRGVSAVHRERESLPILLPRGGLAAAGAGRRGPQAARDRPRAGTLRRRLAQLPDGRGAPRAPVDAAPVTRVALPPAAGSPPPLGALSGARAPFLRTVAPGADRATQVESLPLWEILPADGMPL